MMFVSLNINTTGFARGAGTAHPSGVHPRFQWGSCSSIFCFLCNVLYIVVCPVLLAIVLFVLRFTDSDYPFGIFKLFYILRAYYFNRMSTNNFQNWRLSNWFYEKRTQLLLYWSEHDNTSRSKSKYILVFNLLQVENEVINLSFIMSKLTQSSHSNDWLSDCCEQE